jgi:hypothetical protein
MKNRRVTFRAFLFILLPFIIPSICFSKLAVELGPSYIVNLSNSNWENTEGLNLGFKFQIAHKIYIVPKLSVYKFSSEPKVGTRYPNFTLKSNQICHRKFVFSLVRL